MVMSSSTNFFTLFVTFSGWHVVTQCANVLLLTAPTHKHCDKFGAIGESLLTLGHSVTAYVPRNFDVYNCLAQRNISIINYKTNSNEAIDLSNTATQGKVKSFLATVRGVRNFLCSSILKDETGLNLLYDAQFDLAVVDTAITADCYLLIPYRLNIPFVSLEYWHIWFGSGKPFIPNMETPTFYVDEHVTLLDRVLNSFFVFTRPYYYPWYLRVDSEISFAPELNFFDYVGLIRKSLLFIQDDDVIISGSLPVMPNTIHTGGFTARSSNALPSDIEDMFMSAEHGVIVVAFGGLLEQMSDRILHIMHRVFKDLKQKVLLMSKRPIDLPNIRTMSRIPQNDALGHNNTKLFITDCGRNGAFEAIYHAVPVICLPHFMDQPVIARNLVRCGVAVMLNPRTLSAEKLAEAISVILSGNSYNEAAKRISSIYGALHPQPAGKTAARAIDHVIKYGGEHLRSLSLDHSVMSFVLLDVWLSLFGILVMTAAVIYCCIYSIGFFEKSKK